MALLSVSATAWALSMVVFGLMLLQPAPAGWLRDTVGLSPLVWSLLGLASVAGGEFVFMFMAADRVFPRAGRQPLVLGVELVIVGFGMAALTAAGFVAVWGLST